MAVALVALMVAPALPMADAQGRLVQFRIEPFEDTLFAAVDAAYRVRFDDRGHLWYSTQAGVMRVDIENHTRQLFTRMEGLPSSYTMGLDTRGSTVYAGTDLGLAIIDGETGRVTTRTPLDSPLPDHIVQDVVVRGDQVWMGTYFGGVVTWNVTSDEWKIHNTSTTANFPQPITRITMGDDDVWVTTRGDGVWRHDLGTGEWTVLLKEDGLASNEARVALEHGAILFVANDAGVQVRERPDAAWVTLNETNSGLPDSRVYDLDIIPIEGGGVDLFGATRDGLWQYDFDGTGASQVLDQSFGILGDFIVDNEFTSMGWAIATTRGVSVQRAGEWSYFVTGPSSPEVSSQGPANFMFTSASVGDSGPILWFGASNGISGYRPATGDGLGVWFNRGEWSNYTGGPVNWIDTDGGITWVGSNSGVYGFIHETQEWISRKVTNSRNLVYGVEADKGELWIALFGDGLIMRNLTTGATRAWHATSTPALPDLYLTDVRAQGNEMWLGSSIGAIRMDRVSGAVTATYTSADGIPGAGIVFRVLPEGNAVWIATKDQGVARLDVNAGRVTHVWNATNTPGWPEGEVRSLYREGNHLWAGTTDGLARVHLGTQEVKVYRASDSDLVQNYVNGITSRDGILYLATLSGIARLDLTTDTFLPMHEGPDVPGPRGDAPRAPLVSRVSTTIVSPKHLQLVTGAFQVEGTAFASGGAHVDRVEVQVDDGPWLLAEGTTSWTYAWDTTTLPVDQSVVLRARAFSGPNMSRVAETLAIPTTTPQTPVQIEAIVPPEATAGRPLMLAARATGDPPLVVSAYYKSGNATAFTRLEMTQEGSLWKASVPARDVKEGDVSFYLEARSGRNVEHDPPQASASPYVLNATAAPRLDVDVLAPDSATVTAGEATDVPITVRNVGNTPVTLRLAISAEGPAARWVQVPDEEFTLSPGDERIVQATATVEPGAYAQDRVVTIEARDVSGVADPAVATFALGIKAAAITQGEQTPGDGGSGGFRIPAPGLPLLALAIAGAAALVLRRRSA